MALEAKYGDLHTLRIDRSQKEPDEPKWSKRFIIAGVATVVFLGLVAVALRLFSSSILEVQTVRAATVSSSTAGDTVLQAAAFLAVGSCLICLVPLTRRDSRGATLRTDGAHVLAALRAG